MKTTFEKKLRRWLTDDAKPKSGVTVYVASSGALTVNRSELHASSAYKKQKEALKELEAKLKK